MVALIDIEDITMDQEEVKAADDRFFAALNAMFEGSIEEMEALWSQADDVSTWDRSRACFMSAGR